MSVTDAVLVTGASGQLGRAVLERLLQRGCSRVIAVTRDPERLAEFAARGVELRRADFDNESGLADAFAGARRALLISTDQIADEGARLLQHLGALVALSVAGVEHVVYTSYAGLDVDHALASVADTHRQTELALIGSGLEYTLLRNNLYTELLLDPLRAALDRGVWRTAHGNGAVAYVSRNDVARVAAEALISASGREVWQVSGPAALSAEQIAALAARISGRPLRYEAIAVAERKAELGASGLPAPIVDLLLSFECAAAAGELATVSDVVERVGAAPAQTVAAVLEALR